MKKTLMVLLLSLMLVTVAYSTVFAANGDDVQIILSRKGKRS